MTNEEQKQIDEFFQRYEENFNAGLSGSDTDIQEKVVNSFADCFVGSSPVGVMCGKNDAQFPATIRQGYEFYRSIGTQSMHIRSKELTSLDDFHTMVKVGWQYAAKKKDASQVTIDFNVYYFLSHVGGAPKIFAYVTGDEQKVLKENGLIPRDQ